MRLDDAPTKSPITSIYTTTTLVWYLWLHRVGPKKWHFAYAKDSGDRAKLRSYVERILSMGLDDAPTICVHMCVNMCVNICVNMCANMCVNM
jgi:hypothetical protein